MSNFIKSLLFVTVAIFANNNVVKASNVNNINVKINSSVLSATKNQKNILLNLDISMPNKWHTYYKNPGDVGIKAKIEWDNLPSSVKISPLSFPVPSKLTDMGITSYIYEKNNIELPFLINLDDYQSDTLTLKGKAEFLVCHTSCIPIVKEIKKTIYIKNKSYKKNNFNYSVYNSIPKDEIITDYLLKDDNIYIKLTENMKKPLFIPDYDEVINDSAKQNVVEIYGNDYIEIPKDESFKISKFKSIDGIFKSETNSYKIKAKYKPYPIKEEISFSKVLYTALFALLGGIILNLMPCVLPIIGLKVLTLVKYQTSKERIKSITTYSLGVFISMMMIVSVLLVLRELGHSLSWGFQLQNEYFVWFLIILLTLVGLDLLNIISLGNVISRKTSLISNKYSGEFFAGFLTSFIASSCSAPFMATSIGFALASDSVLLIFTIFTFFALGMALPLIIIAVFPKASNIIPKPGVWTEKFKKILSIPIFLTVLWLLWVVCDFSLFSKEISFHENYSKERITELNKQNKIVFVDFSAKWCLTCQYNKLKVLHTEEIQTLFKQKSIVYMIADWTKKDEHITQELTRLKQAGVPTYVFYLPNEKEKTISNILTLDYLKKEINKIAE